MLQGVDADLVVPSWKAVRCAGPIEQNNQSGRHTIISCDAEPEDPELPEIVQRVQVHWHTENYCVRCQQNGEKFCRFSFPKPVCDSMCIKENEILYGEDLATKYLKRPLQTRFDSLSYVEFFTHYREDATKRPAPPPPYNIDDPDQDIVNDEDPAEVEPELADEQNAGPAIDAADDNADQQVNAGAGGARNQPLVPIYLDCNDPPRRWVYR
ncbi:hypothetical protein BGX30_008463 [Mortierella sp. GBA39]|nr:hypothetical protein BGX30_008463 [Mortierella sp. GBA39]